MRTAAFRWPVYLLAAPVAALAVGTKYAALLFVPTVVVLAGLAAWPYRGRRALIPPVALTMAMAGLLAGASASGRARSYLPASKSTTTARATAHTTVALLKDSLLWGSLPFALAVIGTVAYACGPERAGRAHGAARRPAATDRTGCRAHRDSPARPGGPDSPAHRYVIPEAHRVRAVLRRAHGRSGPGPDHRRSLPPRAGRRGDLGAVPHARHGAGQETSSTRGPTRGRWSRNSPATSSQARTTWSRRPRYRRTTSGQPGRQANSVRVNVLHLIYRPERDNPDTGTPGSRQRSGRDTSR